MMISISRQVAKTALDAPFTAVRCCPKGCGRRCPCVEWTESRHEMPHNNVLRTFTQPVYRCGRHGAFKWNELERRWERARR